MADKVISKQIDLTDTVNGHKLDGSVFGFADYRFQFLHMANLSAGTLTLKFGASDDWIEADAGPTPDLHEELYLKFEEVWIRSSVNPSTIDVIVSLYK